MSGNAKPTRPTDWDEFIRSEPFQSGVADWLAGMWSTEWDGYDWGNFTASAVYETGRLAGSQR